MVMPTYKWTKDLNLQCVGGETQKANKILRKRSKSLILREMKMTMRFYYSYEIGKHLRKLHSGCLSMGGRIGKDEWGQENSNRGGKRGASL